MLSDGERGDVYQLRIPDAYRAEARRRPWGAGRIEAGHPVFHGRELGPDALDHYSEVKNVYYATEG